MVIFFNYAVSYTMALPINESTIRYYKLGKGLKIGGLYSKLLVKLRRIERKDVPLNIHSVVNSENI